MKKIITIIFILIFFLVIPGSARYNNIRKSQISEPVRTEVSTVIHESDTIVFKMRGETKMRLTIRR